MPKKVVDRSLNTYFTDNIALFDGDCFTHKIPTSKNWYFRCWVEAERVASALKILDRKLIKVRTYG